MPTAFDPAKTDSLMQLSNSNLTVTSIVGASVTGTLSVTEVHDIAAFSAVGSTWTPASLPGLIAWYKATDGVYHDAGTTLATDGQTVAQWNDQSGNGLHLNSTASVTPPTYLATGFNGTKTVYFNSINFMATTVNAVSMGTGVLGSVFAVGSITAVPGGSDRIFSYISSGNTVDYDDSASAAWIYLNSSDQMTSYRGFTTYAQEAILPDNTHLRFGNIYDGTHNTNYVNNVAGTPVAASPAWGTPGTFLISSYQTSGGLYMTGYISEVVLTNTALSSTDRINLDNYFKAKWGL